MNEHFSTDSLKSEKFIFIVLICIMLFSLIYMSSYSLLMQNKIDEVQEGIISITQEIATLQDFLPEKDSLIQAQKQKIIEQVQTIEKELVKNKLSDEERKKLAAQLTNLKTQVSQLKLQAKEKLSIKAPVLVQVSSGKDTAFKAKEKEISRLKAIITELQSQQPSVISQNKLSMYYFTAVSADKKNRASKTKTIKLQFQLKGDAKNLEDKYLYIEVRDPSHKIISNQEDKVRINDQYMSEYVFTPYHYTFIKGKYSIKIYSQEAGFQTVTFLTLN